jgi:phage gpG-like protein
MSVKWYGKKVSAKVRAAQIEGINITMAKAVTHAKRNHPWNNRTATLEGSIAIAEPASETANGARGVWGSRDVAYARIHELGGVIKPVRAKALFFRAADGSFVVTKQVRMPARPYLRPAADKEYPSLARRIAKAYERRAR